MAEPKRRYLVLGYIENTPKPKLMFQEDFICLKRVNFQKNVHFIRNFHLIYMAWGRFFHKPLAPLMG